jgi:hypothetical protein
MRPGNSPAGCTWLPYRHRYCMTVLAIAIISALIARGPLHRGDHNGFKGGGRLEVRVVPSPSRTEMIDVTR